MRRTSTTAPSTVVGIVEVASMGSITTPAPASQSSQVRGCTTYVPATNAPAKYCSTVNFSDGIPTTILQHFVSYPNPKQILTQTLQSYICKSVYIFYTVYNIFNIYFFMI